ncbi:MAG: SH3 domain-containing protein [Ktedonobacterales bacterium]|nr:SH3 domain-containing protein [Ktedonobacterales bacterium]
MRQMYPAPDGEASGERRRCRAIGEYAISYPDPISVGAGETIAVSEKSDQWAGNPAWVWLWCTDARGKSGWVPSRWIEFDTAGGNGQIRRDYSARELGVARGEELWAEREESGWLWCVSARGQSGWVPADRVEFLP